MHYSKLCSLSSVQGVFGPSLDAMFLSRLMSSQLLFPLCLFIFCSSGGSSDWEACSDSLKPPASRRNASRSQATWSPPWWRGQQRRWLGLRKEIYVGGLLEKLSAKAAKSFHINTIDQRSAFRKTIRHCKVTKKVLACMFLKRVAAFHGVTRPFRK